MKKLMHLAVFAAAAVLLSSPVVAQPDVAQMDQNLPPPAGPQGAVPMSGSQPASATTMRDTLGAPGMTGRQMADKAFLRAAAQGGIAEVRLGMLAVQKGGPGVKDLGQKVVDDHTEINKDMETIADSLGVMLPKKMSNDGKAEYEKLNGLSGKDFDAEYITYTAKAHRQDLHDFYMEASVAGDAALASEVAKAMMVMHQHLVMVTKLAADEGVVLPPRPPRPAAAAPANR